MDTVFVMTRRMLNGRSPFDSDRQHLHHLLLRRGYSEANTTAVLLMVSALLGGIGMFGSYWAIPDYVLFYGFVGLFIVYFLVANRAWRTLEDAERNKALSNADQDHRDSATATHARRRGTISR
ncbi:MAG: hypothetical protein HC808_02985 [Candidatus Competibacteraceae bacterium]|nr:hypothetical protein [Candidatus Competibacteraceae bacterium]